MTQAAPITRTCSVEGCEREHKAKGLCAMHYMRHYRGNGRANAVGGPKVRIKMNGERTHLLLPHRLNQLGRIVAHLGPKFLCRPSTRGMVRLGNVHGRLELPQPTLRSLLMRGLIEADRVIDERTARYTLTPQGEKSLPNFQSSPVDPMIADFECLHGVVCSGAPPDPKKHDRYFALNWARPRKDPDPIAEGYLGTLFLRVEDKWVEVAALQQVDVDLVWHVKWKGAQSEPMHADLVIDLYLSAEEVSGE